MATSLSLTGGEQELRLQRRDHFDLCVHTVCVCVTIRVVGKEGRMDGVS